MDACKKGDMFLTKKKTNNSNKFAKNLAPPLCFFVFNQLVQILSRSTDSGVFQCTRRTHRFRLNLVRTRLEKSCNKHPGAEGKGNLALFTLKAPPLVSQYPTVHTESTQPRVAGTEAWRIQRETGQSSRSCTAAPTISSSILTLQNYF